MIRRFKELLFFVLFVSLQALVINNIRMFGVITPFVYLYVLLKFRIDISRSALIIVSFLLGLIMDVFSNTYGIHAAACTLTGFVREPLLERFVDMKDLPEGSTPSFHQFGFVKFLRYTLILVSLHHLVLFSIDSFSFKQPFLLIVRLCSSIILTSLLIVVIESFNLKKVKSGERPV